MQIQNNTNIPSQINFGAKVSTVKVLEAATLKLTESESVADLKPIIDTFWDKLFKAAGNRGYRYYLKVIADKITAKYPEIKNAVDEINTYAQSHPRATKGDFRYIQKTIVDRLGSVVDIEV